jgi:hypothetical protein
MFRSRIPTLFSVLTVLCLAVGALAQSNEKAAAAPGGSAAAGPQTPTPSPRTRHLNCWKKAGITPDKINEQWKIQDAGKVKISGVCSDPKLTAAKRVEMIHSVNQETDNEIAKLIPATQLSVYKACETQREAEAKAKARGPQPKELGPCGGTIPANSKDHESHDHSMMSHEN